MADLIISDKDARETILADIEHEQTYIQKKELELELARDNYAKAILEAREFGIPTAEIAARLGKSRQSINKMLARRRKRNGDLTNK